MAHKHGVGAASAPPKRLIGVEEHAGAAAALAPIPDLSHRSRCGGVRLTDTDPAPDLERLRARIVDWLLAEGWQTGKGSGEGAAWALRGQDPGGKVVVIAQESRPPHRLLLHASVRLDGSHTDKLQALDPKRQEDFCWQIRFKLLDMRVDFQGVAVPLERIDLRMRLYAEDLTRTRFFDTLGRLQNAMLYLIWTVRRVLDQPALAPDEADVRVN